MDRKLKKKLSSLGTNPKERIEELFGEVNQHQKKYLSLLYELAIHDIKTGLYNNLFFENILEMEMEKAQRGKQRLSLFIIDVDFFKKVNDTHGHIKADEFLAQLARVLKKQLRASDIAARFWGEEFFIILPETNLQKAKKITSRLRTAIGSDKLLGKYNITVSGGLVEYKKGDTKKSIKERADKALYKAKNTGRDKFVAIE